MSRCSLLALLQADEERLQLESYQRLLSKEQARVDNLWQFERDVWSNHPGHWVVGADEVGRGPLAGPMVAAAVATCSPLFIPGLNDSKKLSPMERELLYERLIREPIRYKISIITVDEISEGNLHHLALHALETAVHRLQCKPAMVFVDGRHQLKTTLYAQRALVGGDGLSAVIAAASIIAKVTRDRMMVELDRQYPGYHLAHNKGYGTADHNEALRTLGPCALHRRNFKPVRERSHQQLALFEA